MGVSGRLGRFVVAAVTLMMFLPMALFRSNQNATVCSPALPAERRAWWISVTRSMTSWCPWPGQRWFEAQVNATVEKNGYFTRKFLDAGALRHASDPRFISLPGKTTVDQIAAKHFFGPAVVLDVHEEGAQDADYRAPASRVEHGRGSTADFGRLDCAA